MTISSNNKAGLDCNNFISDGRYQCQGQVLNGPPWVYGADSGHFFIDVYWHNDNWIVQVAHTVNGPNSYIRHKLGGAWNEWHKILVDTPPQVYNLPLAEGWSGIAKYYKSQENICVVELDILKGSTIESTEVLATLPEGFRPSYHRMQPVITYSPHGSTTIGVDTTGSISFGDVSTQPSIRNIYATLIFIAAN